MKDKLIEAIGRIDKDRTNDCFVYPLDAQKSLDMRIADWNEVLEAARSTLTPPDTQGALDVFNKFCNFIDDLNMNGHFVENDFMNKKEQSIIRTALTRPSREADAEELYHEKMAYKKTLDNLIPATEKTREINAKLLEALKFYAGDDIIIAQGEMCRGLLETTRHEIGDGEPFGTRARQAIAEYE
jgi:hypothetical protein